MRKMLWISIGLCLSCYICANYLWNASLIIPLLITVGAGIVLRFVCRGSIVSQSVSTLLLGCCIGFLWFSAYNYFYLRPIEPMDTVTVPLSITALDYSEPSKYSMSVTGTTKVNGMPYKLVVYFEEDPEICPGDIISGEFRMRVTTPAGARESSYYQGTGMFLTASQKSDLEIHRSDASSIQFWRIAFRRTRKLSQKHCCWVIHPS